MKFSIRDIIAGITLVGGIFLLVQGNIWGLALIGAILTCYGINFAPFIPIGKVKK